MPRSGWLAAGAATGALTASLPLGASLVLVAAVVGAAWLLTGRRRGGRARCVALVLGITAVGFRLAIGSTSLAAVDLAEGTARWTGVVETVGSPREGQLPITLALDVGGVRIAATVPRYPPVQPGDRIAVIGNLAPPDEDTYGAYLRAHALAGSLRGRNIEKLADAEGIGGRLEAVRRASGEALARAMPEPEAGLATGILIGLRDRVDRDIAASFTSSGVSHVVAISGWNIAIVAASITALVRRWPRRPRTLLTLAAIGLYALFAGASPSVLRAALMAAVVLAARESGRAGRAAAALGWAGTLLLVLDPAMISDAGFLLSTVATAGLLVWAEPIAGWMGARAAGRIPGPLCEILGVSLAAQAATLPLVLVLFGRLSLVAPVANLLVVPLVAPAMAAGLVALGGGWLVLLGAPAAFGAVAGLPAWVLLSLMVGVVQACAALPFANVTLDPPLNVVAAGGSGLVLALFGLKRGQAGTRAASLRDQAVVKPDRARGRPPPRRPEKLAIGALSAAIVALGVVVVRTPDGNVHITVMDVGQGDAILIEGNRGGRMLVDGGPDPDRLLVALDGELPPWDRRIDLVVLSHPHEDHVAGLPALLDRYRVGRVVEPGMLGPGPGYRAWAEELALRGVDAGRLASGDSFRLDEIAFSVLWPDPGNVPRAPPDGGTAINNVSIVLLGTYGRERFLLAGDIEEEIDPVLLSRGLPRVDFLKVAHHGSRTSSTDAFLDAVHPSAAVVSVGARNPYGHPSAATLGRLTGRRARVYRTDRDGSVVATLDGSRLTVRPEGRRRAGLKPVVLLASTSTPRLAADLTPRLAADLTPRLAYTCGIPEPRLFGANPA
ncbi:MAG TPA: ComEC/Rec2 family competence protein, partial [Candidatus Limnocylindrales bacterium]